MDGGSAPEGERTYGRADIFPLMWAVSHLAHIALHGEGTFTDLSEAVVFGAGLALLLRPQSGRFLLLLAATQLVDWAANAPFNPDHWTLVGAANLTILLVSTLPMARRRGIVDSATGSLRLLLLIAYGAAAFAKWNSSFLSPGVSCAVWIADRASFGLLDHVPGSGPVAIAIAVGTETMVFALLALRRTRRYGARLGLLFHASVSLSPAIAVSDFTTTVFALFVLFLSNREIDAAIRWLQRSTDGSPVVTTIRRNKWLIPGWLILCGGIAGFSSHTLSLLLIWITASAYIILVLLAIVPTAHFAVPEARPHVSRVAIPAAIFLVFTALNPYLGLRTTGAFTMFSNLGTEGSGGNHLLIEGWHLADYQNELFVVAGSSDENLQLMADDGLALPVAAMRLLPLLASDATVVGTLDGSELTWTAQTSRAVVGDPSFVERWLLSFRPVPLDGISRCGN